MTIDPAPEEPSLIAHARRVRDKLLGVGPGGLAPRAAVALGKMMADWAECDWVGRHEHHTWTGWDEMQHAVSGEIGDAK